jgi:Tfp pilus assembly protein FimT
MAGPFVSPGFHAPRARVRGFSALEMITALAIGMILTVVGIAGLKVFQTERRVDATAARFSNALSGARTLAVAGNGFYRVTLDLRFDNFWIDEIEDPAIDPLADPLTPKVVSPEKFTENVIVEGVLFGGAAEAVTTGPQYFVFRPDGSADNEAIVTFMIRGKDPSDESNLVSVRLYGPTGHNEVFPGERKVF